MGGKVASDNGFALRLLMPLLLTVCLLGCSSSEQKQEPTNSSNGKPSGQDAVKEEMQKLQGTWRAVSGVAEGKAIPKDELSNVKIIFEGDKWTQTRGDIRKKMRYRLGPTLSPKTIDLVETVREIPRRAPPPDKGRRSTGHLRADRRSTQNLFERRSQGATDRL